MISASKLPDSETISKEKEYFSSQLHFFDTLLEYIKHKHGVAFFSKLL
jgi:hypothetical protein